MHYYVRHGQGAEHATMFSLNVGLRGMVFAWMLEVARGLDAGKIEQVGVRVHARR